MTALWSFYTIPEPPLQAFLSRLGTMVHLADLEAWRSLFRRLEAGSPPGELVYRQQPKTGGKPVTHTNWYAGVPDLSADDVPAWRSPSLAAVLREVTLRTAYERHVSRDSRPGTRFAMLPGDDWVDEEDVECERLLANIFRAGTQLPEPLSYLGGADSACVAWLTPPAVRSLIAAEDEAGLLERVGRELKQHEDPLGYDLHDLLALLRRAEASELSVYYCEPGT
jgi:hypothetical protein